MNKGLDGVSMDIPMRCSDDSKSCIYCGLDGKNKPDGITCTEALATEVTRLRAENERLEKVNVWKYAPEYADEAYVKWTGKTTAYYATDTYIRTLPKTIEQEFAEERTDKLIELYPKYAECREELIKVFTEIEERTNDR